MPLYEVAPNVFRLGNRTVNWWAIVAESGLTLIDAGLRRQMDQLEDLLRRLNRAREDVRAVVLTHADLDHIGVAEDLRRAGASVFIHPSEAKAAGGDRRVPPKRALLELWRPSMLMATYEYARDGVLKPRFVGETLAISDGDVLDVPGGPRVLHVPGHTRGSCALFLEESSILFTGDALVTADPLTGRSGPGLLASYDNEDQMQAVRALDKLAATRALHVLPGHGPPSDAGIERAAALAMAG